MNHEDIFKSEVSLDIDACGLSDEEHFSFPDKIDLSYRIELDWRDWGLKDINVSPVGKVEFDIEALDDDDRVIRTIPISIDFEAIDTKLEWVEGHSYVPEMLYIHMTSADVVTEVELSFYYQKQS